MSERFLEGFVVSPAKLAALLAAKTLRNKLGKRSVVRATSGNARVLTLDGAQ